MVLTKSIPRVRDLEDIILHPRVVTTYAFLAITFICDNFFFKFYMTKRRTKRIKFCGKNIGHQARLGENGLFVLFIGSSIAGNLVALLSARYFSHLRALLCAEQDEQCNTRESP